MNLNALERDVRLFAHPDWINYASPEHQNKACAACLFGRAADALRSARELLEDADVTWTDRTTEQEAALRALLSEP